MPKDPIRTENKWSAGRTVSKSSPAISVAQRSPSLLRYKNQIKTSAGRRLLPCPADVTFFSSWIIPIIRSSSKARTARRAFRVIFLGWIFYLTTRASGGEFQIKLSRQPWNCSKVNWLQTDLGNPKIVFSVSIISRVSGRDTRRNVWDFNLHNDNSFQLSGGLWSEH